MKLVGVHHDSAEEIWPHVKGWIEEACLDEGGSYLASDILDAVKQRDMQMWIALEGHRIDAVAITEIRNHPRRKTCWGLIGAGRDFQNWADFRQTIAEWAKSQGCDGKKALKWLARRGWMKTFKEYSCSHVLLERDL